MSTTVTGSNNLTVVPLSHVTSHETSSLVSPASPITVLIHGLDSSSQTWSRVQSKLLPTPSIAVDIRGCGSSPMGDDTDDFGIDTVVNDIKHLLSNHKLVLQSRDATTKIVLVGHSMGAKIAAYYAAKHPRDVAALVLEDMDIRRRPVASNPFGGASSGAAIRGFDRKFATMQDAVEGLTRAGYPKERIEKWVTEGRIYRQEEGYYWSDVNPEFRALCYERFCDNESATSAWKDLAKILADGDGATHDVHFPCYLLVADPDMSICDDGSIGEMKDIMGDSLQVRRFENATHSIHNSAQEEFLNVLDEIYSSFE